MFGLLQIYIARSGGDAVQYRVGHQLALDAQVPLVRSSCEAMSVAQRFSRAFMVSNRSTAFCVVIGVVMKSSTMSSGTVFSSSMSS